MARKRLNRMMTRVEEVNRVRYVEREKTCTPREVLAFAEKVLNLTNSKQERFYVMMLNTQNEIEGCRLVSQGTLDASVVHPREVFAPAIEERAAAVILVHNHPSGDPTPSPADREVTRQLCAAGRIVGIPVRDHVVVAYPGRLASFLDLGMVAA